MNTPAPGWSDALLDDMRHRADPLADATVERFLGHATRLSADTDIAALLAADAPPWQRLALVSRLFEQWKDNRGIAQWHAPEPDTPTEVAEALRSYLDAASVLPDWADPERIRRAEQLFRDHGVLSCTLLFCASLPECYVAPDLAEVLHLAGQLERHTEYRIRSTAAMIFPVMMPGGLTDPEGGGIAQILKVRLIHATIRHLILRGEPQQVLAAKRGADEAGRVAPLAMAGAVPASLHQALFARGWNLADDALPCNQEEQAYTLLTFSYVFLRGLRTLGIGLAPADEEAYLHAWNVAGHLLGIRRELMAETMEQAGLLFERLQSRSRVRFVRPDPRPGLAQALMRTMEDVVPWRLARPLPVLMTRHLCGPRTSRDLGITDRVGWEARLLFAVLMGGARGIDILVRRIQPDFSISRFVTRVVGYRLMTRLLMDQTRPLKLPQHLLSRVEDVMAGWGTDPGAPRWLNDLEDRLTAPGDWKAPVPQ